MRKAAAQAKLQWGRGLKTPEIGIASCSGQRASALQWGRGLKTPEMRRLARSGNPRGGLQWGRGLKTPEIARRHVENFAQADASMGPGS